MKAETKWPRLLGESSVQQMLFSSRQHVGGFLTELLPCDIFFDLDRMLLFLMLLFLMYRFCPFQLSLIR